jgi:hypothetical protein
VATSAVTAWGAANGWSVIIASSARQTGMSIAKISRHSTMARISPNNGPAAAEPTRRRCCAALGG